MNEGYEDGSLWARHRKWAVIAIFVAIVLVIILGASYLLFHKTPTCFDHKQNGTETGIDCGGSCTLVCSASVSPASVRFARALSQSGRTDLIAYIDNPNKDVYAKDAHLTVESYASDGSVASTSVEITLLPGTPTPLFIPGIASGLVRQIFVTFDDGYPEWIKIPASYQPPVSSNIVIESSGLTPRITATITNQTAYERDSIPLVATVFGPDGSVIASSQTIVDVLPPQGSAQAVFTWNEPFADTAARIEVVPLISLPQKLP